ncbi:STRIP2 [Cordylochernes scorpioides]|uniref:STRIP2 n=1 Tax=Cordylochernes scorpioides TaxID=51811 RepID=A0ABY6L8G6_9ARAC|nr:STRIP2 [Cordylochernes scorpioides]
MTTPATATSPSPLFQVEEDLTSKRWDEAADIIYKLCNERYSGPLTDLGITEGDITDAVIYPDDREPLLRTCSTQKKNLITEIISAAIERARDSDPFNIVGETPDLEFVYADADDHVNEIAELYSYTEEYEFFANKSAFEELMAEYGYPTKWNELSESRRAQAALRLLDGIEMSPHDQRMRSVRAVLYILQGTFAECLTLEEQPRRSRDAVFLFCRLGLFPTMVQLLFMEVERVLTQRDVCRNTSAATSAMRTPAVTIGDSTDLRLILSTLYIFVEVMRVAPEPDTEEMRQERETFISDLVNRWCDPGNQPVLGDDLFAVSLLHMVTKFCLGTAPHFPIKKILLLLWKTLLITLGGIEVQSRLKKQYREAAGLPPPPDDTLEVTRTMRAASPPASAADLIEAQQQQQHRDMFRSNTKRSLVKQSSMDDSMANFLEGEQRSQVFFEREGGADEDFDENSGSGNNSGEGPIEEEEPRPPTPRPSTPQPAPTATEGEDASKGLPWVPKVRQKDIKLFLDNTRLKFIGYQLPNDLTTLAGLPQPIHEGLKVLQQHMYISLADVQIEEEEERLKHPLHHKAKPIPQCATELLYQGMLPNLPQYMIGLLKILLASAPTSKAKTESINILTDVLPDEMPTRGTGHDNHVLKEFWCRMSVLQSMKLGIDVNRHKEIVVKAVSSILLLLLKHLKLNHIYQFEYTSQQLMFANCIPLVLKFFNQNITNYVSGKNNISLIDFPTCVIGEQAELTAETLEIGDQQGYCWRNLFSCINLLRVLNKLTKWKHSRIMMLVVFKSAPILKRALKVKHAMLQLYVLKLLKMQTKYLGRQWRKTNMKTISAIYQKVRHRLNDDWAFGNDLDARPWDFQAEEFALQASITRFHAARYDRSGGAAAGPDLEPVDNNFLSVLGRDIELTAEFKTNYERWLAREVFQVSVDWDQLLNPATCQP